MGQEIKEKVLKGIGIPLSIGIAPTKALAKIANYLVKHTPAFKGVLDLTSQQDFSAYLQQVPLSDVWGIGRRLAPRLKTYDLNTAYDFAHARTSFIREQMGIGGVRLAQELRGEPCFALQESPLVKKSLTVSRTFRASTADYEIVREALAYFTIKAGEKLRSHGLVTNQIAIYIRTNRFNHNPKDHRYGFKVLETYTCSTPTLLKASLDLLKMTYRPDFKYNKAGVSLLNLQNPNFVQQSLFTSCGTTLTNNLMEAIDHLNQRFGKETVIFGAQGLNKKWQHTPTRRSPRYTTRWAELPIAKAC